MGGVLNSFGGFLGLSDGPQAPTPEEGNQGLNSMNQAISPYDSTGLQSNLNAYGNGSMSSDDLLGKDYGNGMADTSAANGLATSGQTGSKYATEQVQNNPLLSQGLQGMQGQLQTGQADQAQQQNILNGLQNQGFNLTQGDHTLYGQEAGQIANQYGQQGNQMANSLASRGLSNSGAAGAQFSGLAGSQNQQLANAQQQIAQQRFSNTQNQIAQQQNFIGSLNNQNNAAAGNYNTGAQNAVNQQYGRQLSGVQNQQGLFEAAAGNQTGANASNNQANMAAANFNVANTPMNFGDYMSAGMGQGIQSGMGQATSSMMGGGGSSGGGGGGGGMGGMGMMAALA